MGLKACDRPEARLVTAIRHLRNAVQSVGSSSHFLRRLGAPVGPGDLIHSACGGAVEGGQGDDQGRHGDRPYEGGNTNGGPGAEKPPEPSPKVVCLRIWAWERIGSVGCYPLLSEGVKILSAS